MGNDNFFRELLKQRLPYEIQWLKNQLSTKKLSQRNIKEYEYQIKHKELTAIFYDIDI